MDPAVPVDHWQHGVEPVPGPGREDLEPAATERAPPRRDPAGAQERPRAGAIGQRVPRLPTSFDVLH
jgi:hypothetical protein